jgi:hypothetical protein
MTYVVEKSDPHAVYPHLTDESWITGSVSEAASRFDSVASPQNFPWGDIVSTLLYEGEVSHTDPETGVEVTARHV